MVTPKKDPKLDHVWRLKPESDNTKGRILVKEDRSKIKENYLPTWRQRIKSRLPITPGLPPPHPLRMMLFPPGPRPSRLAFPLEFVMQSADGGLRDLSLHIHWIKQFGWHRFLQERQRIWNAMQLSFCSSLLMIFYVMKMGIYLNTVNL